MYMTKTICDTYPIFVTMAFSVFLVAVLFVPAVNAQDIRIKVLDGRNGRVIREECVNVWVGHTIGALLVPTDNDGVALLHLTDNDAKISIQQSRSACGGYGVVGPVVKYADTIEVSSGYYFDCRPFQKNAPRSTYLVKEVQQSGILTNNTCGKFKTEPEPGEITLFVRPLHWWERLWASLTR
jgi:hypothetical protein